MSARCPGCGAAARAGAPWCTLCHAPLGGTGVPAPRAAATMASGAVTTATTPAAAPAAGAPAGTATTAGTAPLDPPRHRPGGWPCRSCGTTVGWEEARCGACGAAFLADSGEVATRHRQPGGVRARVLALSRGGRLVLALLAAVLLAVAVPLLLSLL